MLSYGNAQNVLSSNANMYRPLVYALFRYAGATYWIKEAKTKWDSKENKDVPDYANWDMNYFSIRFNPYDVASLWGADKDDGEWDAGTSSDACPIKLIYKPD